MERKGKAVVGGISIILVIGAVVGCVVVVSTRNKGKDKLSSSSKAVIAMCEPTDYKEACVDSLAGAAKNQSASPKDLIRSAVEYTVQQVKAAIEKSGIIIKEAKDVNSTGKMAFDDCNELLESAIESLQYSLLTLVDADMPKINEKEADLKNWFSAAMSFQESCIDGIPYEDLKKQMSEAMQNAEQLTSNALAIVSSLSNILGNFNIPLKPNNNPSTARRLLDVEMETDEHGTFPTWFSAADRKLIAKQNKKNNNAGNGQAVKPNAVVAKDGSGQYKTIGAALAAYPKGFQGRYVIYVKAGIYNEYVTVAKNQNNVFMYGDGPRETMVTGRKSFADGITTQDTATFIVVGHGFIARGMGFQNTAGPEKHQAVALRVQSDMSAFFNCRMDGYQDTLYVQAYRQFYRNCVISGTVDFIFGDSTTVIQNSLIIVRKPLANQKNTVTANGRKDQRESTGLVIQNCRIVPEEALFPLRFQIMSYLGRPWKMYSRTVIMESEFGDFIQPAGWLEWQGNFALDTLYYAEYANRGPGAVTTGRVKWKGFHVITDRNVALQFTPGNFLAGGLWLKGTGAPYFLGLKN
ncbi:PREDICTED: pectinesterase-like [Fragaria vesca subsp. vesca]|uniref:pectinesterase-like n=1 Tax=Fragaria vesca subsp. vesca TaxID=101020 RepID=UPI0002C30594|nr:PREDICTED: pectinesterase-like [Fragaria vesca subsp. vesca]